MLRGPYKVWFDDEREVMFEWNLAHTVNVYVPVRARSRWGNVDVFTVGDFADDAASEEQVLAAIRAYVSEDNWPDNWARIRETVVEDLHRRTMR